MRKTDLVSVPARDNFLEAPFSISHFLQPLVLSKSVRPAHCSEVNSQIIGRGLPGVVESFVFEASLGTIGAAARYDDLINRGR